MMPSEPFDLLIRAGRVVCPATGLNGPGAVAVRGGLIAAVGSDVEGDARRVLDFPDHLLLSGLIDLHAHPANSGSVFGIDPDRRMLPRGVTTVLSQGDAGASNWREFVAHTIEPSTTRVRLAINLSRVGESSDEPCFQRLEDADVDACVAAIDQCRDHVWGIAVTASRNSCGPSDPREIVRRALLAAEQTGLPLLYGMRQPGDWPFEQQMRQLRPGDVVTYCFRRQPYGIVQSGRVDPAVREARERGVLFDVGHGRASLDFEAAETALREGFPPDTISTDLHRRHIDHAIPHDLPLVMSKLRAAGMPEPDVLAAVTATPARILNLENQTGALTPGHCADLTILKWQAAAAPLEDCHNATRPAGRWTPEAVIRGGRLESQNGGADKQV